jgi:hypothetical protein
MNHQLYPEMLIPMGLRPIKRYLSTKQLLCIYAQSDRAINVKAVFKFSSLNPMDRAPLNERSAALCEVWASRDTARLTGFCRRTLDRTAQVVPIAERTVLGQGAPMPDDHGPYTPIRARRPFGSRNHRVKR